MIQQILKTLFAFSMLMTTLPANAQLSLGVKAGLGLPTGDLGNLTRVGYGAGISGEYLLMDNRLGLGLSISYNSFAFRKFYATGEVTIVPISLLAKYYLSTGGVKPFIGIEAGQSYVQFSDVNNTYPAGKFNPGLAPMGGLAFRLSEQVVLDLTAKYQVVFSSTLVGANTLNFLSLQLGTAITFGD